METDHYFHQDTFEILEEFIIGRARGNDVKKLCIKNLTVDQIILTRLINLLSNLESLELVRVRNVCGNDQTFNWDIKSTKIEKVFLWPCSVSLGVESLLRSLDRCVIKEAKLKLMKGKVHRHFLKMHEKSLKKLEVMGRFLI